MVLLKMLMEIDPLPMRGSMVMMMVTISPSWRDVSPAEQLRRSPRLVPPRFRLVVAEFCLVSLLMIFFQDERLHIAKDGHQRAARGPTRQGARPGGRARPQPRGWWAAPVWYFFRPIFFYIFWNVPPWSFMTFGDVKNRSLIFAPFPAQNSSCRHSPSSYKPCEIRENSHKYCDIMWNNCP